MHMHLQKNLPILGCLSLERSPWRRTLLRTVPTIPTSQAEHSKPSSKPTLSRVSAPYPPCSSAWKGWEQGKVWKQREFPSVLLRGPSQGIPSPESQTMAQGWVLPI